MNNEDLVKKNLENKSTPNLNEKNRRAAFFNREVMNTIDSTNKRLKLCEERITLLSRKVELIEQNLLNFERKINNNIKVINDELDEFRRDINEIKKVLSKMNDEMKTFAKKELVTTIQKYLDLWNPVKFVTLEELNNILNEKLKR